MQQRAAVQGRLRSETGEVASWLILMAGLALASALAAGVMGSTIVELAERVGGAQVSTGTSTTAQDPSDQPIPGAFPPNDGGDAEATTTGAPTTEERTVPTPDDAPDPDPASDPDGEPETEPEPEPLAPDTQAALERIIEDIDRGDDLGISEGELDDIRDELKDLTPEQREQVLRELSDEQLERLFHNVHSSGFWSNDWNDKERNEFYGLLSELSVDTQQRLSEFTDYFDLYDSDLDPRDVVITEQEFVDGYEAITDLDLDEFLALRAYMWDNPDLIAESPFDWYADGCSIPGGAYPGALNGPCLLHDFAYTNAKIAAERFDAAYTNVEAGDIAEEWKQIADQRLHDDIAELPIWQTGNSEAWADIVYAGVAVDFDEVGLPSGRAAFVDEYVLHYGPGFDPNLGQWSDEWNASYTMDYLVELGTNSAN